MRMVAIAGVGLIGGSFALALRKAGYSGALVGIRSRSTEEALKLGVIDGAITLEEACKTADLLYLAQPVGTILETLGQIAGKVDGNCLVTDAGSTKADICTRAVELGIPLFVGGHPMAGKELRGVRAADADLFRERTYVLTPDESQVKTIRYQELERWIVLIGSRITLLNPKEHDEIVAFTSHLPQVLSSVFAATLAQRALSSNHLQVAGSGLKDTTRLAMSSFEVWGDILRTNSHVLDHALGEFIDKLNFFRQNLTNPDLRDEFERAARFALSIRKSPES